MLAVPPTSFVGRGADLAALAELYADGARLVTVLGPAGIGKTRLALEHASHAAPERVVLCDASEAADAFGLCALVGRALEVPLAGSAADAVTQVGAALASRGRVLVVLDNLEQVAAEAAPVVAGWMRAAPQARLLATSRERLAIPGERVYDLSPLPAPDAVWLFTERARAARHGFVLDEEDRGHVDTIVKELDGIPLAIELAAARVRVLGPAQVVEQLSDRFRLLAGSPRTLAARQTTLRGAIDWSWRLLGPWERSAWAQCSVFRGGFTLQAAEAVLDLSAYPEAPPILDALQAMCDRSLLGAPAGPSSAPRFRQLLSMREYAWERLVESGQAPAAVARHVAHFVGRAQAFRRAGPYGLDAWTWLGAERENLVAAHARALQAGTPDGAVGAAEVTLALEPLLWVQGPLALFGALVDAVLEAPVGLPNALRADALRARVNLHRTAGRLVEGARDLEEALALAAAGGDLRVRAAVEASAGRLALEAGRFDEAALRYESCRRFGRAAGDQMAEGRALQGLANVEAERHAGAVRGRGRARELFAEALTLLEGAGDLLGLGVALGNLGSVHVDEGRLAEAREVLGKALEIHEKLGDRRSAAIALLNLGNVEQERAHLERALEFLERGLQHVREIGYRRVESVAMTLLGGCLSDLGKGEPSRTVLEQAVGLAHGGGDGRQEVMALAYLARAHVARREPEDARVAIERAESLAEHTRHPALEAPVALARGHLEVALGAAARDAGDAEASRAALERARARVQGARAGQLPFEARILLRSLEGLLESTAAATAAPALQSGASLLVGPDARWFQAPQGARVSLVSRRSLRRLLERLVDHRVEAPGQALDLGALFEAGWPGERAQRAAATSRVYVALSTLRKLGLEAVLLRREDGYLLDPEIPLERRN